MFFNCCEQDAPYFPLTRVAHDGKKPLQSSVDYAEQQAQSLKTLGGVCALGAALAGDPYPHWAKGCVLG